MNLTSVGAIKGAEARSFIAASKVISNGSQDIWHTADMTLNESLGLRCCGGCGACTGCSSCSSCSCAPGAPGGEAPGAGDVGGSNPAPGGVRLQAPVTLAPGVMFRSVDDGGGTGGDGGTGGTGGTSGAGW